MPGKEAVEKMFDSIAPDYDALNHILSLGVDRLWRRRAVRNMGLSRDVESRVLDVACGTADFTAAVADRFPKAQIYGVDLSEQMLERGREKLAALGLSDRTHYVKGDCEHLDFADCRFDALCVGFGVRNFEHREACLKEMLRVLKPGGKLVILELSVPRNAVLRGLYKVYFLKILPAVGGLVSGDRAAYEYLPASVLAFPAPDVFCRTLAECGFSEVRHRPLTMGICRMFVATKA